MVSWELFGLNDDDGDTFSGEGCGGVGSTGATSDDEDSGRFGLISEYFRHGVSGNPTLKVRTTDMSKQLRSRVSYCGGAFGMLWLDFLVSYIKHDEDSGV